MIFFTCSLAVDDWEDNGSIKLYSHGSPESRKIDLTTRRQLRLLKIGGGLVVTKEKGQTKMAISDNHKEDVVKFTKDGTISLLVSDLITDLVGSKN